MPFRRLLALCLFALAFLPVAPAAHAAETTPTETRALSAAQADHSAYTLSPDKLVKAETLSTIRVINHFGATAWTIFILILILQLGIAARMRNVAVNLSKNRFAQGFTFFLQFLFLLTILTLPLEIYSHSVSLRYGLSVQSWGSWLGDQAKTFAITYVIGGLFVMLVFRLITWSPRRWWLWLWFPTMAFTILGVFLTPYVIDPLFNKFEPLTKTNPALVQQLQRVVARGQGINIPPDRMFLMKASDKVTTLNAYVTGFGASKRVVVWDTSIAKATPDEILFIFGHEMGHYVLGHIFRGIAFSFALILVTFFLGFRLFQFLLAKFGKQWRIPTQDHWGAFVILFLVLTVLGFVSEPLENAYSRVQEHAADVYGMEVVHGIIADPQAAGQGAFQLIGENSFVAPDPSPLVAFWSGSHPPIWLRAAFARHYNPWVADEQPKYFKK